MNVNGLLTIIFSIIAVALGTYGISTIVTMEPGPFSIFDRLREALQGDESHPVDESVPELFPLNLLKDSRSELELKLPPFEHTMRGTLHGILDCSICFGLWLSIPIMLLPVWMGLITLVEYPLAWLAAYGLHRFLLGIAGDI